MNTINQFDMLQAAVDGFVKAADISVETIEKLIGDFASSEAVREYEICRDSTTADLHANEAQELNVEQAEDQMWNQLEETDYRFKASGLAENKIAGRWARAKAKDQGNIDQAGRKLRDQFSDNSANATPSGSGRKWQGKACEG